MNTYHNQIDLTLSRVPDIAAKTCAQIDELFTVDELKNSGKVYIIGDGVAYAAALALKYAFTKYTDWTGNWVSPMTERNFAYEVSEGELDFGQNFILQLHCSDSDEDIAADVSKKLSTHRALCYTAAADICGEAGEYIELFAKGLCMALKIGTAQGKISSEYADNILSTLADYANAQRQMLVDLADQCQSIARDMSSQVRNFETIGTGLDYAAAWLIRLMLYRKTGKVTTVEESEDYLHVNSLNVNPDQFATFVINSALNPAYDRTLLTIGNVYRIKRFEVVLTDGPVSDIPYPVEVTPLPACSEYPLKGLCNFVPGALIAEALCI